MLEKVYFWSLFYCHWWFTSFDPVMFHRVRPTLWNQVWKVMYMLWRRGRRHNQWRTSVWEFTCVKACWVCSALYFTPLLPVVVLSNSSNLLFLCDAMNSFLILSVSLLCVSLNGCHNFALLTLLLSQILTGNLIIISTSANKTIATCCDPSLTITCASCGEWRVTVAINVTTVNFR